MSEIISQWFYIYTCGVDHVITIRVYPKNIGHHSGGHEFVMWYGIRADGNEVVVL